MKSAAFLPAFVTLTFFTAPVAANACGKWEQIEMALLRESREMSCRHYPNWHPICAELAVAAAAERAGQATRAQIDLLHGPKCPRG